MKAALAIVGGCLLVLLGAVYRERHFGSPREWAGTALLACGFALIWAVPT